MSENQWTWTITTIPPQRKHWWEAWRFNYWSARADLNGMVRDGIALDNFPPVCLWGSGHSEGEAESEAKRAAQNFALRKQRDRVRKPEIFVVET